MCWCSRSATRCAWDYWVPVARYTNDYYNPPTRVHATFPADATSYYGVSPLALAATPGDLTLKAQSADTQLVPSALSEAPIIDARCTGDRELIVPIGGARLGCRLARR